jgi:hypothetical protein
MFNLCVGYDENLALGSIKLPYTFTAEEGPRVMVELVISNVLQLIVPLVPTEADPEDPLKYTSSADVGTEKPPVPPDVSDQFVVVLPSHVPAPPTQYLLAIL